MSSVCYLKGSTRISYEGRCWCNTGFTFLDAEAEEFDHVGMVGKYLHQIELPNQVRLTTLRRTLFKINGYCFELTTMHLGRKKLEI